MIQLAQHSSELVDAVHVVAEEVVPRVTIARVVVRRRQLDLSARQLADVILPERTKLRAASV